METLTVPYEGKKGMALSVPLPPYAVAYLTKTKASDEAGANKVTLVTITFALRLKNEFSYGDIRQRLLNAGQTLSDWSFLNLSGKFGTGFAAGGYCACSYQVEGDRGVAIPDKNTRDNYANNQSEVLGSVVTAKVADDIQAALQGVNK